MMNPTLNSSGFVFVATAAAGQTLPQKAAILLNCALSSGSGTAVATFVDQTIQTTAPSASGQVQFTGTGTAPSDALTFDSALTVDDEIVGTYVPRAAFPRAS